MRAEASPHHFLLVGNGPYANRGCEAIVRGTVNALRNAFGDAVQVTVASLGGDRAVAAQAAEERDERVHHVSLLPDSGRLAPVLRQVGVGTVRRYALRRAFRALSALLPSATAVLCIGGDNYTLDYRLPWVFLDLDEFVMHHRAPLVLWGASVGPFSTRPRLERRMLRHLSRFDLLLVREPVTFDDLRSKGLNGTLALSADPAFAMPAEEPEGGVARTGVPDGAIGINLGPLMACYVTHGDVRLWAERSARLVAAVAAAAGRAVVLVPHVSSPHDDDHAFLVRVAQEATRTTTRPVGVLPPGLTAAETKWAISRCAAFAGTRTHALIAAFSTAVPTLSLGYSRKAEGISLSMYGSSDHWLRIEEATEERVAAGVMVLLESSEAIRATLSAQASAMRERAMEAGWHLRRLVEEGTAVSPKAAPGWTLD